jgi:hypothetical protein
MSIGGRAVVVCVMRWDRENEKMTWKAHFYCGKLVVINILTHKMLYIKTHAEFTDWETKG